MTLAMTFRGRLPVPATVLVADDDAAIRSFVKRALTAEGYTVLAAPNGAAALDLLRRCGPHGPAAILLDLDMPVMNGPQFVAAYRRTRGPHAPIVLMSAAPDGWQHCRQLGASAWLPKPFDLDRLLDCIRAPSPDTDLVAA